MMASPPPTRYRDLARVALGSDSVPYDTKSHRPIPSLESLIRQESYSPYDSEEPSELGYQSPSKYNHQASHGPQPAFLAIPNSSHRSPDQYLQHNRDLSVGGSSLAPSPLLHTQFRVSTATEQTRLSGSEYSYGWEDNGSADQLDPRWPSNSSKYNHSPLASSPIPSRHDAPSRVDESPVLPPSSPHNSPIPISLDSPVVPNGPIDKQAMGGSSERSSPSGRSKETPEEALRRSTWRSSDSEPPDPFLYKSYEETSDNPPVVVVHSPEPRRSDDTIIRTPPRLKTAQPVGQHQVEPIVLASPTLSREEVNKSGRSKVVKPANISYNFSRPIAKARASPSPSSSSTPNSTPVSASPSMDNPNTIPPDIPPTQSSVLSTIQSSPTPQRGPPSPYLTSEPSNFQQPSPQQQLPQRRPSYPYRIPDANVSYQQRSFSEGRLSPQTSYRNSPSSNPPVNSSRSGSPAYRSNSRSQRSPSPISATHLSPNYIPASSAPPNAYYTARPSPSSSPSFEQQNIPYQQQRSVSSPSPQQYPYQTSYTQQSPLHVSIPNAPPSRATSPVSIYSNYSFYNLSGEGRLSPGDEGTIQSHDHRPPPHIEQTFPPESDSPFVPPYATSSQTPASPYSVPHLGPGMYTPTSRLHPTMANKTGANSIISRRSPPLLPLPPSSLPPTAETPEDFLALGITHHENDKLQLSAYCFERAAKDSGGCGAGMLMWGLTLRHGWGVQKDEKRAYVWLRRAAECAVGDLEVARADDGKSKGDAGIAAQKELVIAVYEVGQCYFHGWGVPQDKEMGLEYFGVAARMGDADAQLELGFCFANGKGCKKDKKKAAKWYRAAVAQGASNVGLAWIYKNKYM